MQSCNRLARQPDRLVAHHLLDGTLIIAELGQHLAGVLADTRSRAADRGFVELKSRGGLWLAHPSNGRLVEFGDDAARHHLFVMDDLAATQDRRTRHVRGIKSLEPLRG